MRATRAAIYARSATDSCPACQRDACQAFAQQRGWTVVDCYTDQRASAADFERPALQHLLRDVAAGGVDVVVVHDMARLARSSADLARIVAALDEAHAGLVSVREGLCIGLERSRSRQEAAT